MDRLIADGVKVDAVITDPPYNIARANNFHTMKNKYGKQAHRRGIDFGEWDKGFDLFTWIVKGVELLDKDGSMFIFNDWKNIGEIAKYAESLGMEIKDCFRWEKLNPMPRNRDRRYITDFEMAVWLVKKGSKWVFNRQDAKFERPKFVSGLVSGKEKTEHTTQKPIKLMEHIVAIHTNENHTVLDPFMGSGTTGVACVNTNRNFIGIEMDDEYFEIAKERIYNKKENK
jgi:site-specific DNA-methyltransferase (adenine-specific)/modification methylase